MDESSDPRRLLLGKKAVEKGLLTTGQFREALAEQQRRAASTGTPPPLGGILVDLGFLTRAQLESLLPKDDTPTRLRGLGSTTGKTGEIKFGKYIIQKRLGKGGAGLVVEALDTQLQRNVAIKLLVSSDIEDAEEAAREETRFVREARMSANLPKHPHIVGVYETGVLEGRRYIAMELIKGQQMNVWRKTPAATLRQQVRLLRDVALAVEHAHQEGIIHRDLKPHNILVDDDHQPHVADFGVAKMRRINSDNSLTLSGKVVGTPSYMSPEQAEGRKTVDRRTDVWALGVMLFETLTGRPPFKGDSPVEILMKLVKDPVPAPSTMVRSSSIDGSLERICLKALEKNPMNRYPSARAFADDLTRWLKGKAVSATTKVRRKSSAGAWAAVAAAMITLAVTALVLAWPSSDPYARDLAQAERLLNSGNLTEAELRFKLILEKAPDHDRARAGRAESARRRATRLKRDLAQGKRLLEEGKYPAALATYGRVLALDPGNAEAHRGTLDAQQRMKADLAAAKQAAASLPKPVVIKKEEPESKPAPPAPKKDAKKVAKATAPPKKKVESPKPVPPPQPRKVTPPPTKPATRGPAPALSPSAPALRAPLRGHKNGVIAVCFSPDGRMLASSDYLGTVQLWDRAAGTPLRTLSIEDKAGSVRSLAFSPDGKTLAVARDSGKIVLFDAATGSETGRLPGHRVTVTSVRFVSNGLLASTGFDGTARIWTLASSSEKWKFGHYAGGASATAASPDGRRLAVGAVGGSIQTWDLETGTRAKEFPGHSEIVTALAYAPDGQRLASASRDARIQILNATSGTRERILSGHRGWVTGVAFSPDGSRLASSSEDSTVRLWDLRTGAELAVLKLNEENSQFTSIAFSPDGSLLAAGCKNWSVVLWNVPVVAAPATSGSAEATRSVLSALWKKVVEAKARLVGKTVAFEKKGFPLKKATIKGIDDRNLTLALNVSGGLFESPEPVDHLPSKTLAEVFTRAFPEADPELRLEIAIVFAELGDFGKAYRELSLARGKTPRCPATARTILRREWDSLKKETPEDRQEDALQKLLRRREAFVTDEIRKSLGAP